MRSLASHVTGLKNSTRAFLNWLVIVVGNLPNITPVVAAPVDRLGNCKQFVRAAGYGHFIETYVGATSPCGIVLFGHTYEGTTIPNDAEPAL